MAVYNASTSASLSLEGGLTEEDLKKFQEADLRKDRVASMLQRTFSTPAPSSYRPPRSSTCPSRSFNWNINGPTLNSRSLRSISSPSRVNSIPTKQTIPKFHSLMESDSSSSYDFSYKTYEPKDLSSQSVDNSTFSEQQLFETSIQGLAELNEDPNLLVQNCASRVGRSISSPEGLHPVRPSNCYPFYSPSSPGRFTYSSSTRTVSHGVLNARYNMYTSVPTASHLPSPSLSFSGEYQVTSSDRSVQNVLSSALPGISRSLNSSLYSSRTSERGGMEIEPLGGSAMDETSFQAHSGGTSSYWPGDHSSRVNVRLLRGSMEERPRLSQLALAHLTSRDLSSIRFQTPPPSYEKLCNPEALPTYQEAIEGERRGFKRLQDHRMVFTLPSVPDFNPSHTDPLLQESDRNFSGGILASLAAELSDSEGGYTTILDAIPFHPLRETATPVPVRFVSRWSITRLRPPRGRLQCCSSVCNEALVKKELNRRWPFIVGAREDERCLGLLVVECSSNLTVAQLSEGPSSAGTVEGSGLSSSRDALESPLTTNPERNEAEFSSMDLNLETSAVSSHVVFYLCGKCVCYDSFDAERVQNHIEDDCTRQANKWATVSELYLVMRAFCLGLVVILVLMWLPLGRW